MEGLGFLLKCPSKTILEQIFVQTFKVRSATEAPELISNSLVAALKITKQQAQQLFSSICYIVQIAVYENSSALGPLFPEDFHKDLKGLILQVITAHLVEWREDALRTQCSLPKLKAIDWRIDVKRASEMISNMSVPTVLVQLTVEQNPNRVGLESKLKTVNLELNKQTLETMLDGLKKIKDQLGSFK